MSEMRVAFCGASGTGKSRLAAFLATEFGLELNPVGSRSVSKDMGFDSPYDVDRAGRRQEFQRLLVDRKCAWEAERSSFVTDRTTMDNLAYTVMHDSHGITEDLIESCVDGLERYTLIFFCPVAAFCNPDGDTQRVQSLAYHRMYEVMVHGLLVMGGRTPRVLDMSAWDARTSYVRKTVGYYL